MKYYKQIIEAHRGSSGYEYQNTIPAFDKALEQKADAIELDIRKTKDGKIIVVHDPDYKGLKTKEATYEELLEKTKTDGFIMPLLEDVLRKYKGKILLDIEIKEEGYTKEILDLILSVLTYREFQIRSFSEKVCKEVKTLDKNVFVILLIGSAKPKYGFLTRLAELFPLAKVIRSHCDAVSPHYLLVRLGYVNRLHLIGKPVFVWTVNEEEIMKKMLRNKVDGIVTNYPDIALRLQEEYNNLKKQKVR